MRSYGYRRGSGGKGEFRGGDGLVREIELLVPAQVTFLCDRRRSSPYGLAGGENGATGKTLLIHSDGSAIELPAKGTVQVGQNDLIRMETPGGGGWGAPAIKN
jgi:N-methylhydantoinase B